ncbi:helicase-associated domain-containing protein [Allostreptomyces psammosilenae]|uniref:DNA-binding protein n=1 Tax=Allostreptomyces psammosilenae TaxID=1892865 RepID=A0A853ABA6_9ACTN|nr:helicase-associated domain-containing protein [Allostreptomyces psammosilenae]NYI07652.1 hypothetical protein [Allostreptomyces psammosilenae]
MTTRPTEQPLRRPAPRTLAEDLRARGDDALAAVLRARPDLLSPIPADLTQLATRASTRTSVIRALERLDRFTLEVAEALAVAPDGTSHETLLHLLVGDGSRPAVPPEGAGGTPGGATGTAGGTTTGGAPTGPAAVPAPTAAELDAPLADALGRLRAQALLWGPPDALHLIRTVRDMLAPPPLPSSPGTPTASGQPAAAPALAASPTGLGPTLAECTAGMSPARLQQMLADLGLPPTPDPVSAVAAITDLFRDRDRLGALIAQAPEGAMRVLARLVWGPPLGSVQDATRPVSAEQAGTPVEWLLAHALLIPFGRRSVVLPREVGLHLRGGRAHRELHPAPPTPPPTRHDPATVDAAAAGQAFAALRVVEELLEDWTSAGPPVLRAGGLGVRDLRRTAAALDLTEAEAAFWLEVAYAAGLVASDGEDDESYAPTPAYDAWLALPAERRWTALVTPWLSATRSSGPVGGRDGRGRVLGVLGPGLDRGPAPEIRALTLGLLAQAGPGAALTAEQLVEVVGWYRPLRASRARTVTPAGVPTERDGSAVPATTGAGRGTLRDDLVRWTVREAAWLGVTGRGALSSFARALLPDGPGPGSPRAEAPQAEAPQAEGPQAEGAGESTVLAELSRLVAEAAAGDAAEGGEGAENAAVARIADLAGAHERADTVRRAATAARLLAPLLPEPLDHVLLQADLTAIAPGPLRGDLAAAMALAADIESKGGATVYRFTPESVRRALDAGRTAAELRDFLAEHSRTPLPQPLAYLIDDVARRHGRLRVGAASAYLRCDDEALLAEIVTDRRALHLGLRRLAPTVLAAAAAPDVVLERLREMGYAPAAESDAGDVVINRPDRRRTPPRTPPAPVPDSPAPPDEVLLRAVVRAVRAGEGGSAQQRGAAAPALGGSGAGSGAGAGSRNGAARLRPGELPRGTPAETLAALQAAALGGEQVWIGYLDTEGGGGRRLIAPLRVAGGFVTAYDHQGDTVRTFALHRITGVADAEVDG